MFYINVRENMIPYRIKFLQYNERHCINVGTGF